MRSVLALDIGGANLKSAHSDGTAGTEPFAVWRQPKELGRAIATLVVRMPGCDVLAVTMTAELCDCFETKADGVNHVLDAVEFAVSSLARPVPIRVWLSDGRLVPPFYARAEPLKAAASNWLALATWAGRLCPEGAAIVIDIGSTTTDIIPLRDGVPVPQGRTDTARLMSDELVYTGVKRTPLCALALGLPRFGLHGQPCRVAAELFATTRDVYMRLNDLPEQPDDTDTADGRPGTRGNTASRLARMVCADTSMLRDEDIDSIARQFAQIQEDILVVAGSAVQDRLEDRAQSVVLAGSGEFLGRRVAQELWPNGIRIISLSELLGPEVSAAACAYALAVLAAEESQAGTAR